MVIVEFLLVKFINTPHNASNADLNFFLLPRKHKLVSLKMAKAILARTQPVTLHSRTFPMYKANFFSQALDQNICFVHVGVLKLMQNKLIVDNSLNHLTDVHGKELKNPFKVQLKLHSSNKLPKSLYTLFVVWYPLIYCF